MRQEWIRGTEMCVDWASHDSCLPFFCGVTTLNSCWSVEAVAGLVGVAGDFCTI